jgi:hippurate hydrolase
MTTPATLLEEANALSSSLLTTRRFLHTHPGTGFDIEDSLTYVKSQLETLGYEPQPCGKAGLVAIAGGKKPGKVFLLRADMDGLPIREEAEVDFRSENGKMHGCGHDLHTTMLLGAAKLLKDHEDEIQGTVKLMFQPAEEIFQGSQDMIENGLLEHPAVDGALMIHVMAGMAFPSGTVIVSGAGVSAPAADVFEIHLQGKGCHGSMPNTGIDPLTAAAHLVIALQELSARELAMDDRAVLTVGTFHAGTAANAIPDSVTLSGTIRTFDEETRAYLKERLCQMAQGISATFRTQATVTFPSGCPTLVNDRALSQEAQTYVTELLGQERTFSATQLAALAAGTKDKTGKTAGSEDFAYVSQQVPSIMLALAAGRPQDGYSYPQHHPMVKFDESVLPIGSAVYAYTALRWLEEHS